MYTRRQKTNTITEIVLMLSNLMIEIFWNTLMAVIAYFCWYYPIGLYQNAVPTHEVTSRGGLVFLFIWAFMMFTSTFTHILIAGIDSADSAGSVGNICYMLCICFCGYVSSSCLSPLRPLYDDKLSFKTSILPQQHPRQEGFSTRILDIHVLYLSVYVARIRASFDRCSQHGYRVCIE